MTTPGKLLQNQALDYLNSFDGSFFWQNDSVGLKGRKRLTRYRPNGLPDIMGVINGMTAFVEIKYGADKLSATQIETIERLRRNGAKVLIAKTLDDVISWRENGCRTEEEAKDQAKDQEKAAGEKDKKQSRSADKIQT